jgi:hypothetical protein
MTPDNNNYKCPSCGGDMKLNTSAGTLHCDICNRNEETYVADEEIVELNFDSIEADPGSNDWGVAAKTMICKKCGCLFVVPEGSIDSFCIFCGCKDMTPAEAPAGIKPDSIIPFKTDAEKAVSMLHGWINKRRLAPRFF